MIIGSFKKFGLLLTLFGVFQCNFSDKIYADPARTISVAGGLISCASLLSVLGAQLSSYSDSNSSIVWLGAAGTSVGVAGLLIGRGLKERSVRARQPFDEHERRRQDLVHLPKFFHDYYLLNMRPPFATMIQERYDPVEILTDEGFWWHPQNIFYPYFAEHAPDMQNQMRHQGRALPVIDASQHQAEIDAAKARILQANGGQ